jgi:hypothetical protein
VGNPVMVADKPRPGRHTGFIDAKFA